MARVYEADGWHQYAMSFRDPYRQLESPEREIEVIDGALSFLAQSGILPHARYDKHRLLAHRRAVRETFEVPWTAITPRMERLLYAVNAIARPRVMVAVGVFCGFTFICNAGAAVGPGSCYKPRRLVGLEIVPEEAARAQRNVDMIVKDGSAQIIAADGIPWLQSHDGPIDLLCLDADGRGGRGKAIYLDLVQAALHCLHTGSLVLAHNSVNSAGKLGEYLSYVRDPDNFRESVNVIIDDQGLEVSHR